MDQIETITSELLKLKGQGLVLAFCIGLGYLVKHTPFFPNKWIPHLVILFGAGLNPCIIGRGNVSPDIHNPVAHLVLQGFLVGVAAFALHHLFIARIEAWLGDKIKPAAMILAASLGLVGCATQLDEGAYQGDAVLYNIDATYLHTRNMLDIVFEWEANADLSKLAPDVRPRMNAARVAAIKADSEFHKLRRAYIASPSKRGEDALGKVLSRLESVLAAANSIYSKL